MTPAKELQHACYQQAGSTPMHDCMIGTVVQRALRTTPEENRACVLDRIA